MTEPAVGDPDGTVTEVAVTLLGGFGVVVDGEEVADWPGSRPRQLVQLLALAPDRSRPRDRVLEALWPDADEDSAASSLYKAAHQARRAAGSDDAVVLTGGRVRLFPAAVVTVDAAAFRDAAERALAGGDDHACREAAGGYGGELLPGAELAWAAQPRRELHALQVRLLRRTGSWERLVALEPADEQAHRELMRSHAEAGNRDAAVRQFARLREALDRELGIRPGSRTLETYRDIVTDDAAGPGLPPMVGRGAELRRARRTLRRAADGEPAGLLVVGPTGIGTTRLARQLVAEARDAGWATLSAAADPTGGPHRPIHDAVADLRRRRPDLGEVLAGELAALEAARQQPEGPAPPPTPVSGEAAVGRTGTAVVDLLSALARLTGGALLVLDDVHHADAATLVLVRQVLRGAHGAVAVVMTARDGRLPAGLTEQRDAMLRERLVDELGLGPLEEGPTRTLIARRLPDAGPGTLARIARASGGNPLFAEELATAERDGLAGTPASVRAILQARVERLKRPVRGALRRVAVTAGRVGAGELQALADLDDEEVAAVLDAALEAGILVDDGDAYRFRHELLRETLRADLPRHRRREVHARAADRLEQTGGPPGRVARHLREAGRPDEAVPWLRRAAREARAAGAHRRALDLLDEAVDTGRGEPDADVLGLRADLLLLIGDPAASGAYNRALAAAPTGARTDLRLRLARAYLAQGRYEAAGEVVTDLEPDTPAHRVTRLIVRGFVAWHRGDLDEAREVAGEAHAAAQAAGRGFEANEALALQAVVAHSAGQWRVDDVSELVRTTIAPELTASPWDPHLCLGEHLVHGPDPAGELVDFAEGLRTTARQRGSERGEAFATTLLGEAQRTAGRFAAAAETHGQAVALHRRLGSTAGEVLSLLGRAGSLHASGAVGDARAALAEADELVPRSPLAVHLEERVHEARVRAALDGPDPVAAVDAAEEAMGDRPSCPSCAVGRWLASARACARGGAVGRARGLLERVEEATGPLGATEFAARRTLVRAELAAATGDDDAGRLFARAAERFRGIGHPAGEREARTAAGTVGKDPVRPPP